MTRTTSSTIDAATAVATADRVTFLDVRSPAEFETQHIAGSYNVPLDVLKGRSREVAERLGDDAVVLVCQSGPRAVEAQRVLAATGAVGTQVLTGGLPAFAAAGGATDAGRSRWALERQVRLVAGSIVLAGIVASLKFPRARFVAGGIGGGLTFSALTNTCAMGNLLARLPYNRGTQPRDARTYVEQLPH